MKIHHNICRNLCPQKIRLVHSATLPSADEASPDSKRTPTKNTQAQVHGHFAMLCPASGTCCRAEHTPKYKRHCIFSAAAKIMFVFNSFVTHQPTHPPPHPTPLPLSVFFLPQFPSCIHFSFMFTNHNKHVAVYMDPNCATCKWTLTLTLRCDKVVQSVAEVGCSSAHPLLEGTLTAGGRWE